MRHFEKQKPQRSSRSASIRGLDLLGPCDRADYNKSASMNHQYSVRIVLKLERVGQLISESFTRRDDFSGGNSFIWSHLEQSKTPAPFNSSGRPTGLRGTGVP